MALKEKEKDDKDFLQGGENLRDELLAVIDAEIDQQQDQDKVRKLVRARSAIEIHLRDY